MYFVFRRNDGYVGSINASTPERGRHALAGWRSGDYTATFEILLETAVWSEAHDRIVAERARPDYPVFE